MKKMLFALLLTPVFLTAVEKPLAKEKQITIRAALRSALASHPSLKASAKAEAARHQELLAANGQWLPSLDLSIASGREGNENSTTDASSDEHLSLTRFDSSLSLRQQLYTGGRIGAQIERRQALARESSFDLALLKEQLSFRLAETYVDYCRNRALLKLARENVKAHKEIVTTVIARKQQGISRSSDVVQAKGRLALAQAQLKRELANSAAFSEQYLEVVGTLPVDNIKEPFSLAGVLPKNLSQAKKVLTQKHPALLARKMNVAANKASIVEADAAFRPQISLELRASENDNGGGVRGNDDSYSAMLRLDWNLFRGGSDKATRLARLLEQEQSQELLLDEQRKLERNVAVSWYNYSGTLIELNYFLQHQQAALDTIKAYRDQYQRNQRSLFDLLNAQNEYFLSSSRFIETSYQKQIQVYRIMFEAGTLFSALQTK